MSKSKKYLAGRVGGWVRTLIGKPRTRAGHLREHGEWGAQSEKGAGGQSRKREQSAAQGNLDPAAPFVSAAVTIASASASTPTAVTLAMTAPSRLRGRCGSAGILIAVQGPPRLPVPRLRSPARSMHDYDRERGC
ncbi:hypothetical protein R5R35_011122 [Gryllus longicercus]|uniref:Uncharacterized protein n=1 Tax=Gryllus longicercus TaxID=2509291 RepID=A0AAN9Z469_9ORTH